MRGGVDTGKIVTDQCFVVDSPQQLLNCRVRSPFSANTQIKVNGSYPLPQGFTVSGTFQDVPGPPIEANYAVPNSQIAPSLGRNLAACGAPRVHVGGRCPADRPADYVRGPTGAARPATEQGVPAGRDEAAHPSTSTTF